MNFIDKIERENTLANQELLFRAFQYAYYKSHDNSTRVGAAFREPKTNFIVRGSNIIPGYQKREEIPTHKLEKPLKYELIQHAEENLMQRITEAGISPVGGIVGLNWFPCHDQLKSCSRILHENQISKLVVSIDALYRSPPHWNKSLTNAYEFLMDNQIPVRGYEGKLLVPALMSGEEWIA